MSGSCLDAALAYARAGLPVFPVRGKVPATDHGFKDATRDEETIRRFWADDSSYGVAVPTGTPSHGVVLDVDPRHGGDRSLQGLVAQYDTLPDGPRARTGGGGWHYWFSCPDGTLRTVHGFRAGLDLQAEGAYVVMPPSPHPSGSRYQWENPLNGGQLPPLPSWLLAVATSHHEDLGLPVVTTSEGKVPHGRHHETIVAATASLASKIGGLSEPALIAATRGALAPLLDDLVTHDAEIVAAARSALGKFGHPIPSAVADRSAWSELVTGAGRDFHLFDPYPLEFVFATLATVDMPGDPVWAFLVGPPSSLKTEILRWVNQVPLVYTLSSLTPASLITGLVTKKGTVAQSLMPLLDGKCLVVKDFSTVLDMRRESRDDIMSQLRDAYDGYASKYFGTVGKLGFSSHFHMLAGVTSAIEDYWSIHSALGPRYLKIRIPEADSGFVTALANSGEEEHLRQRFEELSLRVFHSLPADGWKDVDASAFRQAEDIIDLVARGRTHVPRINGFIARSPEIERLPRLTKVLRKLAIGRATLYGRSAVEGADLEFVSRVAADSMLEIRANVLRKLEHPLPFVELARHLRLPRTTLERYLEDMEALDMVQVHEELDPRYLSEERTRKVVSIGPRARYLPPSRTLSGGTRERPGGEDGESP
ncbi:MAG: bifunctional DNA primase/polymerase [Candidatus Thermoplasmatota archaeon]|nr:bifunctional DNA primase/polymerase [Candidatus Thermoplasmatota archaeon]MCL5983213.1 bifunctional DNA primase/polymerase [Candidatus Thermoplasmatota archaeon]